jgi:hypothetical protein
MIYVLLKQALNHSYFSCWLEVLIWGREERRKGVLFTNFIGLAPGLLFNKPQTALETIG